MGVHTRGHGPETFPFLANHGLAAPCELLFKEVTPSQTGLELQICSRLRVLHLIVTESEDEHDDKDDGGNGDEDDMMRRSRWGGFTDIRGSALIVFLFDSDDS
jgi:hypothetical protein